MTTLVVTAAQQIGSSLVQTAGQAALSFASRSIAHAFDNRTFESPRLDSFHLQTSRDGAPMARIYGRSRLAGQVIWASRLTEHVKEESAGGKGGGPTIRNFSYTISFAIGLCEGKIASLERIWANGTLLPTQNITLRLYKGTEDQLPDPIIVATEGDAAPAFRGTAYIVFEDFPLAEYGNRLPQINVEVLRIPETLADGSRLENLVTGVNLLPSSGEFAYSTDVVEKILGEGIADPVNMNNLSGAADILKALDQLEDQLPACRSVSIIISWFGTDLRCGHCEIRPGVEDRSHFTGETVWSVGPDTRETAYQVSRDDENDRPIYGGTPSDASIIQTIAELKQRGIKVSIYPFILMDVPLNNDLPDPYGRAVQPPFPWRGRITCHPASGQTGSPDKTSDVNAQIDNFFGQCQVSDFSLVQNFVDYQGPHEYGFRRFILHYAHLAALAGGVDQFLIESEMRGMTTLRDGADSYPVVEKLKGLASDVKAVLGTNTSISYAADWSEYFGHHPSDGSGDVYFHLDPLWASSDIDAVAIDMYWPLSDWRGGTSHLDAEATPDIYSKAYLSGNVQGGEGYDWFYASVEDREAQTRTPITDGAYNEPWVYRYKDVLNWWQNPHYNRDAGVRRHQSTEWQPEMKPFWFTEIGCPAVDKGANQPNVFYDPKSSESFLPYHSNGARDDFIQRRYIESFIEYWSEDTARNPVSSVYGGPMIDLEATHVWCWDARPYPDFPARETVWADGPNWERGHWLTGRVGLIPLADVVRDLSVKAGADGVDVTRVTGLVQGYVLDRPMTTRAALEPLGVVYGFNMIETAGGLRFVSLGSEDRINLTLEDLAADSFVTLERTKEDSEGQLKDVRLHFIDGARDYQIGSMSARNLTAETVRVLDVNAPIVMDHTFGRFVTERLLQTAAISDEVITLPLASGRMDVEVGDTVSIQGLDLSWRIEALDGVTARQLSARRQAPQDAVPLCGVKPDIIPLPPWIAQPVPLVLDIPDSSGQGTRNGPWVGVSLNPFVTTQIDIADIITSELSRAAAIGTLVTSCGSGPVWRWDHGTSFEIGWTHGVLASVTHDALFAGANLFALETDAGWEIIQARQIELIAPQTYRISNMLRGQFGTEAQAGSVAQIGARIVKLSTGLENVPLLPDYIGQDISLLARTANRESDPFTFAYEGAHLRPLSPVHGKVVMGDDTSYVSWIRRTRIGGDNWVAMEVPLGETREFYRVQIMAGDNLIGEYETDMSEFTFDASISASHILIAQGSEIYEFGPALRIDL